MYILAVVVLLVKSLNLFAFLLTDLTPAFFRVRTPGWFRVCVYVYLLDRSCDEIQPHLFSKEITLLGKIVIVARD